jgi:hypothetical protein
LGIIASYTQLPAIVATGAPEQYLCVQPLSTNRSWHFNRNHIEEFWVAVFRLRP